MKLPKQIKPEKPQEESASAIYNVDLGLFKALKELRNQLAAEEHVPAYIIFADAALRDMCRKLPQTNAEFLNVSGVGNAKMAKYGDKFTGLIKAYRGKHPDVFTSQ